MRRQCIIAIALTCVATVVATQANGTVIRVPEEQEIAVHCWHCGAWVKVPCSKDDWWHRPPVPTRCPKCYSLIEMPRVPWPVLDGPWDQIHRLPPGICPEQLLQSVPTPIVP